MWSCAVASMVGTGIFCLSVSAPPTPLGVTRREEQNRSVCEQLAHVESVCSIVSPRESQVASKLLEINIMMYYFDLVYAFICVILQLFTLAFLLDAHWLFIVLAVVLQVSY